MLLYADDTILMSNNPTSLQKSLNDFVNYCQEWKLEINIDKTKAMTPKGASVASAENF